MKGMEIAVTTRKRAHFQYGIVLFMAQMLAVTFAEPHGAVFDLRSHCQRDNIIYEKAQVKHEALCAFLCKRDINCVMFAHNKTSKECLTSKRADGLTPGNCMRTYVEKDRVEKSLKLHQTLSPELLGSLQVLFNFRISTKNLIDTDKYKATLTADTEMSDEGIKINALSSSYIDIDTASGSLFRGKFPTSLNYTFVFKTDGKSSDRQEIMRISNCVTGHEMFRIWRTSDPESQIKSRLVHQSSSMKYKYYFVYPPPMDGEFYGSVTFRAGAYHKLFFHLKNNTQEAIGALTSHVLPYNTTGENNDCFRLGNWGSYNFSNGYFKCLAIFNRSLSVDEWREFNAHC